MDSLRGYSETPGLVRTHLIWMLVDNHANCGQYDNPNK